MGECPLIRNVELLVKDTRLSVVRVNLRRYGWLLPRFTGTDELQLKTAVEELLAADDEFLLPEDLNLKLALLCGQPKMKFHFVTSSGVHQSA